MEQQFGKLPEKNERQDSSSIIDKMALEPSYLEQLPSIEKMLTDIEQAVLTGKSEASGLIREFELIEKIQKVNKNILFLNKDDVHTFLKVMHFQNNSEHPEYYEVEKIGAMYDPISKKIGILVSPLEISEKNNRTRARVLAGLSHEVLHGLAQNIEITWLNEAITERLTQGLIGDIISSSDEWDEVFANLSDDEEDKIRFSSYKKERSELNELCETIRDTCSAYSNLPNSNYKELSKGESTVFKDNLGDTYFSGNTTILERNLKELGYSSISELESLDPNQ